MCAEVVELIQPNAIRMAIIVTFKVVQMIRKDIFKDSNRCFLAEAKYYERCYRNWIGGKSKLLQIDAIYGFISALVGHSVIV